jgi:hypothetical protein
VEVRESYSPSTVIPGDRSQGTKRGATQLIEKLQSFAFHWKEQVHSFDQNFFVFVLGLSKVKYLYVGLSKLSNFYFTIDFKLNNM